MIESLSKLDKFAAAGILARAALALEDDSNPAANPRSSEEALLRQQVLTGVRNRLGVKSDDRTPETIARIADMLDSESDSLVGSVNDDAVLSALSDKGQLPSDLYDVSIIPNVSEFQGKNFDREAALIRATVRSPDLEQHIGPGAGPGAPFLISLFAKVFTDKYPIRSFVMLVAGERNGMHLVVHQAWRLYQDDVDLVGAKDPIEMLKRFANTFGIDVALGGKKGRFIEIADIPPAEEIPNVIKITHRDTKPTLFTVTYFVQRNPASKLRRAAMVVAINLNRYRDSIRHHDSAWR